MKKASNPYEAITSTKVGETIDKEELKKLLRNKPEVKKVPITVDQIFNAFAWRPEKEA